MDIETRRPRNLGVDANGRLKPCPGSPNCVCSQSPEGDRHAVAPLAFEGSADDAMARLRAVIERLPGASVVRAGRRYLHAEVRSRLLGFVDDVECFCEPRQRTIHLRSASRTGYWDLGVNRRRIAAIRRAFGNSA